MNKILLRLALIAGKAGLPDAKKAKASDAANVQALNARFNNFSPPIVFSCLKFAVLYLMGDMSRKFDEL